MDKFLITRKSENRKIGPMLLTTSPRCTCPLACPLRKHSGTDLAGVCYAEHGMLGGFLWTKLDTLEPGETFQQGQIQIHDLAELLRTIRELPDGTIWRHNQAGDLATTDQINIDADKLIALIEANRGRRGFTYTHFDVLKNRHNRSLVRRANQAGFTINLSANTLPEADTLADLDCGPVVALVPADQTHNTQTPQGRKVVICPATVRSDVTCASCQLCARARDFVIAFPAHGRRHERVQETPAA